MDNLTIKLLHERKTRRPHRKCDGYSGKLYPFTWSDEHSAYCYTTANQEEADDLFNSMGRSSSYFAPVITIAPAKRPKPISALIEHELTLRGITLEGEFATDAIGTIAVQAWEKGMETALARLATPVPSPESPPPQPPVDNAHVADGAEKFAEPPAPFEPSASPAPDLGGTTVTPPPAKKRKPAKAAV